MNRFMLALAASAALAAPMSAQAAAVVEGFVPGPDNSFLINLSFLNDSTSTLNITSLTLDGSSAQPVSLLWDSLATANPAGATVDIAGLNTTVVVFTFGGDGWNPGESFGLYGVDPDAVHDPEYGAAVYSLRGTTVTFGFSDSSSAVYSFVDDPAEGAGLRLNTVSAVPEPATWAMMIAGFGMVGSLVRRRRGTTATA